MENTIRIVLVDDHSLVLEGINSRLSEEEHFEIVGQASNGLEALEVVKNTQPDVVLMDVQMPIMDGTEAVKRICEYEIQKGLRHTPISALTAALRFVEVASAIREVVPRSFII